MVYILYHLVVLTVKENVCMAFKLLWSFLL